MLDHDNRVRDEFTRQAETFSASAAITDKALTERFVVALGDAARGSVLDVACGPGILSAAIAKSAREVVAFDLTPQMLKKAAQRCADAGLENVTFREGNATELPYADAAFDAVVTRLSVHHFDRPERVMSEIFRVLRPGGHFVLADVISSEVPAELELQNAIDILRDPSHVRMLPGSDLTSLVEETGGLRHRIPDLLGQAARVRGMDGHCQRCVARPATARGGPGAGERWGVRRNGIVGGRWEDQVVPPMEFDRGAEITRRPGFHCAPSGLRRIITRLLRSPAPIRPSPRSCRR